MDRWRGTTAVVTGASAGIGAAICVKLADEGLRVVGLARRPQRIDELKPLVRGTGTIVSRKCDVSSSEEVAASFEWIDDNFGGVSVLVNNAGVFYGGCITSKMAYTTDASGEEMSEAKVLSTIDINVKGTVLCARRATASMLRHGHRGHIININSLAGHYIPFKRTFNVYPSTKYAVTAFTGALLNELADTEAGIKVTSLSPGLVATELAGVPHDGALPALRPADIADAVLYLLSTPPHVNIEELTINPVKGKRL